MLAARKTTGLDLIKSERQRQADIAQALGAIDRLDAVILPTTPITAIPIAEVDEGKTTMATHTRVVNYLEMCALSVPMGLSPEGLPMGLQIVARRFDEPLALRIGQAYEATRGPWKVPG
jgi:aspartyl-tRNA(Asn)/glutamyl-tRNA(Gln) amidotransferase subunit A